MMQHDSSPKIKLEGTVHRLCFVNMKPRLLAGLALIFVGLAGCAPHRLYRPDYSLCLSASPETGCAKHALQEYQPGTGGKDGYFLGFIEFDDQGQLFDRAQMNAVLDGMYREAAVEGQDFINVVFVHGWKHSAVEGDSNIATFREALRRLSEAEQAIAVATGLRPRKIMGVYLGWRGGSITAPVLKELTFWDRKNTAHNVGYGAVTEVLSRLDLVRLTKDSLAEDGRSHSRSVVVGHSFGGAVVYSALAQLLEARFVRTVGPVGATTDAEGFGNLVVLINPAFEAELFAPLSDMSLERGTYFKTQLPVLAVLTSEADNATKVAFPLGRRFSTLLEKERKVTRKNPVTRQTEIIDQRKTGITALGHFASYRTHELRAVDGAAAVEINARSAEQAARHFSTASQNWENDAPGNEIQFPGSVLKRTANSAGRNPYLVVKVDKRLIADHNDLSNPRILEFIKNMILVSSQSHDLAERSSQRSKALSK